MKLIDLNTIRAIGNMIADTDDRDSEPGYLDTLEGETDVMDIADHLIGLALDDAAMIEAMKDQETAMRARRKRIEHRVAKNRQAMLDLLRAAGLRKLERPRATISQRAGDESLVIIDAEAIPSQLCITKTVVKPDNAAIKARLKAGEEIPGCALARGDDGITMRVA